DQLLSVEIVIFGAVTSARTHRAQSDTCRLIVIQMESEAGSGCAYPADAGFSLQSLQLTDALKGYVVCAGQASQSVSL
ncbi:MAG: hypothetical protein PVG72_08870, partial [Gammaproteobacteria bacterium]